MDLPEFLLARIADAEEVVRQYRAVWDYEDEPPSPFHPYLIEKEDPWLCVDPRHVLAECRSKRQIVERAATYVDRKSTGDRVADAGVTVGWSVYEAVLRNLALPYADHPDYDPSWRP